VDNLGKVTEFKGVTSGFSTRHADHLFSKIDSPAFYLLR
jgi:hypothetical protein